MYQAGRPDLLQMPYAGEFGVFGLSSSGMAIFGNALYVPGRPAGGLPLSLFRRLVLEADSVSEVIALVEERGIAAVGSLTVGDRTGRVVAIENTDHGYAVVEAVNGLLAHANHINGPALAQYEDYEEPERSTSVHRQQRLADQLEVERGRLTAPLAMRCLMDHEGYPNSICRHATPGRDFQTTAAVVVEPKLGRLYAVRGLPCQGWPVTYTL
jgi:isopenicillin-N N-acyltransferase-like protein